MTQLSSCDILTNWSSSTASLSIDTVDKQEGAGALLVTTTAVWNTYIVLTNNSGTWDFSANPNIRLLIKASNAAPLRLEIYSDWQHMSYINLSDAPISWTQIKALIINSVSAGSLGPADFTKVKFIQLRYNNANNLYTIRFDNLEMLDSLALEASAVPLSQSAAINTDITFTTTPNGGTPPYKYQWFSGTPSNGSILLGETNPSITITSAISGTLSLYCQVTDSSLTPTSVLTNEVQAIFTDAPQYTTIVNKNFVSSPTIAPFSFSGSGSYDFNTNGIALTNIGSVGGERAMISYVNFLPEINYAELTINFMVSNNTGCGLLRLTNSSLQQSTHLLFVDIFNGQLHFVYYNNGDVRVSLAPITVDALNTLKIKVQLGYGDGTMAVSLNDVVVANYSNLYNAGMPAFNQLDLGQIWTATIGTCTINSVLLEGSILQTTTISGRVTDSAGNPLQNVTVGIGLAIGTNQFISRILTSTLTAADGSYMLSPPKGQYLMEAFKEGYAEKTLYNITINDSMSFDFVLNSTSLIEPSPISQKSYYPTRSIWIFPYAYNYSLRDGTNTPSSSLLNTIAALKQEMPSINTIDLRTHWKPDTELLPIYSTNNNTTTWEDLTAAIKAAHTNGLRVRLGLVSYENIAYTVDPAIWFARYEAILLEAATFAEANNVEELVLEWELLWTDLKLEDGTYADSYWVPITQKVKAVYSGKLTIHPNHWTQKTTSWSIPLADYISKSKNFLALLDYISMSNFHCATASTSTPNVDAPYLEAYQSHFDDPDFGVGDGVVPNVIAMFQQAGIRVLVNFGYWKYWGAPMTYASWMNKNPKDSTEVAILFKAALDALDTAGIACYGTDIEHYETPTSPTDVTSNIRGEHATVIINAGLASHAFAPLWTLAISATNGGTVSPIGTITGEAESNTEPIMAISDVGHHLVNWIMDDGTINAKSYPPENNPISIKINDALTHTLRAIFGADENAVLNGTIVDLANVPIIGATVQAGIYSTVTNDAGQYVLSLPLEIYTLVVTKKGFATKTITVDLTQGSITQNIALTPTFPIIQAGIGGLGILGIGLILLLSKYSKKRKG